MKKILCHLFCILLLCLLPVSASAQEIDLSEMIQSDTRRQYVETMLKYYLTQDAAVRQTLQDGYSAVFLFEGASDNMDDPELSDISYYRVSAVCLAVRLDEEGSPYLAYFNRECSSLPDRPLEYGAWDIDKIGAVGPATIRDGTYELFSVKHGGKYEALHIRTDVEDGTLPAIYMHENGYVDHRADCINIHTRNVNHVIQGAMWSSGCLLVGGGDFGAFTELMDSIYYPLYAQFSIGDRVGTVTIDRQLLKQPMYDLYQNNNAVDLLLSASRQIQPETYLISCGKPQTYEKVSEMKILRDTTLMSLPCSASTDVRSVDLGQRKTGDWVDITGTIVNSAGNVWYTTQWQGKTAYLYGGDVGEITWTDRFMDWLTG